MKTLPAFFQQFTPAQLRSQYRRNAEQLGTMAAKAASTGRKVNGYTADQLRALQAKTSKNAQ